MKKILAVDIGGTDIKLGIVTTEGEILSHGAIETRAGDDPRVTAGRVGEWFDARKGDDPDICAAGIDCAGLVDGEKGVLYTSPNLPGWENVAMKEIYEERLGVPVTFENDANCAAWGEYVMGAGRGTSHFVCLTLGTGVGGGIVAAGALYRGWQGLAAEIGHHVVLAEGPECACGNRGCLEALIGASRIVRRMKDEKAGNGKTVPEDISVKDISTAAGKGDREALKVLAETGFFLGIGLANIVHVLNPEVIAIGGGVGGAGELILEPARKTMKDHLMGDILSPVRVVPAELGNRASFLGAALLACADRKI